MRSKKFLLIFCGVLLVAGVLTVLLAPFAVATGIRLWVARTAQQEGLQIEFGKIEAPLLRPVILHNLKVTSKPETPFHVTIDSPQVEVALNLSALFSGNRGHVLRSLTTDGISIDIRRNQQSNSQRFAWRTLGDLLANNFRLSNIDLHVENGETTVDLQGGTLSGTQIEAGVFAAREFTVASPLFRKSFSQLRGTTSWQENRLTIGALNLTRGLDLDAIKIDLSQIGESRIGLELNMDAFGGKLRASISSDDHADKRTWDVAGNASEISLAQMSEALDFTDCAGGSLHACKFTFRGETTNLREATATVWAEVTGLTWRDRTADMIVIGASLYNRQVQIEQVYVRQRDNQLTLTGDSALPEKLADWLNPDFRGDISASINDLGDFARLFGAKPSDFAGKIEIAGNVSAHERKLGGQLMVSGNSLTVFRTPVESLEVKLNLRESLLEITNLELCRKNDYFRGEANLDLAHGGSYTGNFSIYVAEAADYVALFPAWLRSTPIGGSMNLDWTAKGTEAGHSGTFHARGHALHPLEVPIVPFEAELEGEYSPDGVFFRQLNLSNPNASVTAFVTIAKDYLQFQSLRLDLNGSSKLQGNVFLPLSIPKMQTFDDWLGGLNDHPTFDLNLAVVDSMDLGELTRAIFTQPKLQGQASGSIELHGPIGTLDGKSILHLQNLAYGNDPRLSANLETQLSRGVFRGKGNANPFGSNPVDFEWSLPFRIEKQDPTYVFKTDPPFVATINFPAVFVSKLPRYLSRGLFVDGILSGHLALSNTLLDPRFTGDVQLINARFLSGASLSTKLTFQGQTATIDFARLTQNDSPAPIRGKGKNLVDRVQYDARGSIEFSGWDKIEARILPTTPIAILAPLESSDCVSKIEFSAPNVGSARRERFGEVTLQGNLTSSEWSISLSGQNVDDPDNAFQAGVLTRTFSICDQPGKTLTLGLARPTFP